MQEYVSKSINKLNELLTQHPTADIRFNSYGNAANCGCKFLVCDIFYNSAVNTIYIG